MTTDRLEVLVVGGGQAGPRDRLPPGPSGLRFAILEAGATRWRASRGVAKVRRDSLVFERLDEGVKRVGPSSAAAC